VIHHEGVYDNIAGWLAGKEKLDIFAMYDLLADMYGPDNPSNHLAKLLNDYRDLQWRLEELGK
jgi:hypothetical protein